MPPKPVVLMRRVECSYHPRNCKSNGSMESGNVCTTKTSVIVSTSFSPCWRQDLEPSHDEHFHTDQHERRKARSVTMFEPCPRVTGRNPVRCGSSAGQLPKRQGANHRMILQDHHEQTKQPKYHHSGGCVRVTLVHETAKDGAKRRCAVMCPSKVLARLQPVGPRETSTVAATQQAKRNRPTRSVRFDPHVKVITVPSYRDLDEATVHGMWWGPADILQFRAAGTLFFGKHGKHGIVATEEELAEASMPRSGMPEFRKSSIRTTAGKAVAAILLAALSVPSAATFIRRGQRRRKASGRVAEGAAESGGVDIGKTATVARAGPQAGGMTAVEDLETIWELDDESPGGVRGDKLHEEASDGRMTAAATSGSISTKKTAAGDCRPLCASRVRCCMSHKLSSRLNRQQVAWVNDFGMSAWQQSPPSPVRRAHTTLRSVPRVPATADVTISVDALKVVARRERDRLDAVAESSCSAKIMNEQHAVVPLSEIGATSPHGDYSKKRPAISREQQGSFSPDPRNAIVGKE